MYYPKNRPLYVRISTIILKSFKCIIEATSTVEVFFSRTFSQTAKIIQN
jgi:hypothetical protein